MNCSTCGKDLDNYARNGGHDPTCLAYKAQQWEARAYRLYNLIEATSTSHTWHKVRQIVRVTKSGLEWNEGYPCPGSEWWPIEK